MVATHVIKTRVSPDIKARVSDEAQRELLTESLWLRRVVAGALARAPASGERLSRTAAADNLNAGPRHGKCSDAGPIAQTRLYARLRPDDRLIVQERADARGMPASTYVAALVRAHLRTLAPLPREELAALKRSIAELGSLGRNLNQIARVAHQTGRITGPGQDDLRLMLKICEAMREHIKALVRANVATWESGHAETGD